jgi:hypothetical protein
MCHSVGGRWLGFETYFLFSPDKGWLQADIPRHGATPVLQRWRRRDARGKEKTLIPAPQSMVTGFRALRIGRDVGGLQNHSGSKFNHFPLSEPKYNASAFYHPLSK